MKFGVSLGRSSASLVLGEGSPKVSGLRPPKPHKLKTKKQTTDDFESSLSRIGELDRASNKTLSLKDVDF